MERTHIDSKLSRDEYCGDSIGPPVPQSSQGKQEEEEDEDMIGPMPPPPVRKATDNDDDDDSEAEEEASLDLCPKYLSYPHIHSPRIQSVCHRCQH